MVVLFERVLSLCAFPRHAQIVRLPQNRLYAAVTVLGTSNIPHLSSRASFDLPVSSSTARFCHSPRREIGCSVQQLRWSPCHEMSHASMPWKCCRSAIRFRQRCVAHGSGPNLVFRIHATNARRPWNWPAKLPQSLLTSSVSARNPSISAIECAWRKP